MFLTQQRARSGRDCVRGARSATRAAGIVLVAIGVAACGSGGGVKTESPVAVSATVSATPTSTPTAGTDEAAILVAYREFFARQTEISMAPKEQRRVLLEPFTADPTLERVLRGMFAADEIGEVGYGEPVVDPQVTKVAGDTATVTDCQDTSKTGRKKRSTGKVTTRGLDRDNVSTTMLRGGDGAWRVSAVDYLDEPC